MSKTLDGIGNYGGSGGSSNPILQSFVTYNADYEEGEWTPILYDIPTPEDYTPSIAVGTYVKIGKQVTCMFNLVFDYDSSIDKPLLLGGWPFKITTIDGLGSGSASIELTSVNLAGLTNPCTLEFWTAGAQQNVSPNQLSPVLHTFDGLTAALGSRSGGIIAGLYTPAYTNDLGATNQKINGTITYITDEE